MSSRPEDIINKIRQDSVVGRGTCSPVDECYSDTELVTEFGTHPDGRLRTPAQALKAAREMHEVWMDRYNDIRGTAF